MCFMSTADFDSVIRGHHIYKAVWHPIVGEILAVCIEQGNVNGSVRTTGLSNGRSCSTRSRQSKSRVETDWRFICVPF